MCSAMLSSHIAPVRRDAWEHSAERSNAAHSRGVCNAARK